MKKILSLMALLMLSITATWASTVDDLVAVGPGYTFIADDITSNGTVKLVANTLYDSDRIFANTGNTVAANKGNSTFAGGTHLNSLRVKNTQDQLVFKVSEPCVVTFYTQKVGDRGIQAGSSTGGTQYGTQTGNTATFECTIPAAGLVYLSSFGGDFYFAGFVVTAKPKTVYFDNTASSWTTPTAYAWIPGEPATVISDAWPGTEMTLNGETGLYEWTTTGNPTKIIFSDNGSKQTADLGFVDGATYDKDGINLTVTFKTTGWENVYAYTWTGSNHELGDWPGTKMTATGETDTWSTSFSAASAPANIIFHNNEGNQTPDLTFVNEKAYIYNDYTATFRTDAAWENVYAYTWTGSNHELGDWPGTKLDATAGVYNLSFKAFSAPLQILFHNNDGTQTNDQPFVDGKAYKYITAAPLFAIASTQAAIAAGTTVDIKDAEEDKVATLTYGFEGGAEFAAASNGYGSNDDYAVMEYMTAGNGQDGTATSGTCYIINPLYDGTITIGVRLNGNKNFFILEDGEAMEGYNGITIATVTNTSYSFPVKGGSTYKIYCTGSKLGFFGFDYTGYTKTYTVAGTKDLTGTPDDWDIVDANRMVLNGETGLYEWTANDIIVSSTVIPEFKVWMNNDTWIPAGDNWKITLGAISAAVAGKYNIKITINPSTKAIAVTGTKTYEALDISDKGWATTVTNSALDFSAAGIEAYTATLSGTTVTLNKVENVPAETGLVLKGEEAIHYIPVAASSSTPKGDLGFSSTLTYTVNDSYKKCFGLAIKNEKAQFVKIKNAEVIPAQKAFLEVEPSTPANEFTVVFEDESGEATGIQTLNAERNTLYGETYNLAGQKVNKSYKGLVISNGIKVVIK